MRRSLKLIPILAVLGGVLTGGLISTAAAQDASPADHPVVDIDRSRHAGRDGIGVPR